MEKIDLIASKRTVLGKKNHLLRADGKVPGVVYGRKVKSEAVELDSKLMERVYRQAGGNRIIALKIGDGRTRNVLIHEVQQSATKGELIHIDFYVVNMDEMLKAEIPLRFVGESTAVYQGEGSLMHVMESVEVECLPADLPEAVEVDISVLDDFEKTLTLADLSLPQGVKLVDEDLTAIIVKVEPPRSDEEMAELEENVDEAAQLPEGVAEDQTVIAEENGGNKDR